MKMGSSMWKWKYRVKRNPKWLLTPLVLMMVLLFLRMLFMWKSAGYFLLFLLLTGVVVAVGFRMSKSKKKRPKRMMTWKKR